MQRVTRSQAKKAQALAQAQGNDELASSSFWLPSVQASPALQEQPHSAKPTGSTVSSGSRHLRPGDWRAAAAAETGGGPVQAPPADFSFAVDNTPNIDDVHSPASSIFTDGAASPAINSCNGTPNALSPLRPRVLATSSVLDAAATRTGTPATQGGTPAMAKEAACGGQTTQGSPASLSGGEVSFTWQSQSAGDDDDVEQPEMPQPLSPQSPAAALQRAGSLGELSTPGSCGYNSPLASAAVQEQQPPESIMRSSVTHNPLFVDRPAPVPKSDAVVKALSLTPCSNVDGNGAAAAPAPGSHGTVAQPMPPSTEPPSPMLPPLDLETPRRSIKGLSAMFGTAGPTNSAVSGPNAAASNRQQATPCSGAGQPGRAAAAAPAPAADATPCSWPAPRVSVADARDASRADAAASAASPVASPGTSSRRSSLQVDLDDTTGPRNLDQTPRKTGRSSPAKTKDAQAKQASSQRRVSLSSAPSSQPVANSPAAQTGERASAAVQPKQLQRASAGSTLWSAVSWSAVLLCVLLLAINNPFSTMQSSNGVIELNKLGPVCFREPYPGAWLNWPADSSMAMPSSLAVGAGRGVDSVQPDLSIAASPLVPSADVAGVEPHGSAEQAATEQHEATVGALVDTQLEPAVEEAEMQQASAVEGVAEAPVAQADADSSASDIEQPSVVSEHAAEQQLESVQEDLRAPAAASDVPETDVQLVEPSAESMNVSVESVEVEVEQAAPASVPEAAASEAPSVEEAAATPVPAEAPDAADVPVAEAQAAAADDEASSGDSSAAKQQGTRRFLGWSLAELFIGVVLACATGAGLALAVERYGLYPDAQREAAAAAERAVAALQQAPKVVEVATPAPLPLTPTSRILKLRTPLRAGAPWSNERAAAEPDTSAGAHERDVQRTPAGAFVWKQNRLVYVEEGLE
ncbi:hypothetical protein HYH02_007244 [Chlamydomonas schloesseri]|uniref:Uncharacterized protein n=1 Tax=Chlamydomonas schloesseri TaxID=2026947 RepID=A0A836B505_9CHLO|nr:hypothetical protein HYH02_007244 [Chlamydomonas schloesseri]|eukprot:KAG2447787.1 hypothetical protein HYH02_007244 [Chlamydomonas schloesseri]